MFEIEFYRTREGSCPMEAFLDSLDQRMAIKALQELTLLSEKGTWLVNSIGTSGQQILVPPINCVGTVHKQAGTARVEHRIP